MSSAASVGGLISGIDTNSILDQLYQLARAPIRRLEAEKETLNTQSVAWSQLEVRLINFRANASQLASPAGFLVYAAATSHPDLVTATASSSAVPGTYSLTVQALAQTHQLGSQGYADTDQTEVGSGTITITVGDGDPTVIDVDDFTLAELRDSINNADAGVSAAIINDGSDTDPYRLLLTAKTGGLDGEMSLVVSLAGGTAPTFSDVQPAQDAEIELGSGAGAITISSGSNTFDDVIQGVSFTALDADPTTTVTLTVTRDNQAIQTRITDMVETYNALAGFFSEQFDYNPDTGASGALFADFRLHTLQDDLAAALGNPIVGLSGEYAALAELGVRFDSTGRLTTDPTVLTSAIANNLDDLVDVFAAVGSTTHSDVAFLAATTDTRPSGPAGWAVDITQAASQARVTAGVAQTESLAADETLTLNGANIYLTAGMTQTDVIDAINAAQAETGLIAAATDSDGQGTGNYLTLTRIAYGSSYHTTAASTVSNQGGSDTSGIGNVTVTDETPGGESGTGTGAAGLDVEGTIGDESATGFGRRLTADEGDPDGLALLISGTETGAYGHVVFTVGAAEAAFRVAISAADTLDGAIFLAQDYIDDTMLDIDQEIARLEDLIEQQQQRLRASFARMEQALGQFEAQSQFLASQFAQMQANAAAT